MPRTTFIPTKAELTERARVVREVGFTDELGREHRPWSDRRYYGTSKESAPRPYRFPMYAIETGRA